MIYCWCVLLELDSPGECDLLYEALTGQEECMYESFTGERAITSILSGGFLNVSSYFKRSR